ncbi:MAG: type II secretion system minor pseudopilin GspK [Gammaproteobacteria bacterium]|nr:type II secretion system minor pseudopilin GspK [Gammaproteobacteria bacterium]
MIRLRAARQTGVALLTALLITSVAAVAAVSMAARQQLDIRRTGNVLDADQAYLFTLGVESWAKEILARDRRDGEVDQPGEDWATILPPIAVEGAVVAGRIEDLQGRFNLNNLVDADGKASEDDVRRFRRLLAALELDENLADAVVDWIDTDLDPRFPNGAEDPAYLGMAPPYRTANALMQSPSELLLVNGVTREIYDALAPYVATLPARTPLNVNTASAPVLMALNEGITESDASQLIDERGEKGYQTTEEFLAHPLLKERGQGITNISVSTSYFMIYANARFERSRVDLNSLVARGADARVSVIRRSQGTV